MSGGLRILRLTVRRRPGFPRGGLGLDGLSPGVNLVRGPNASGKSSAARSLQELLWPGAAGDDRSLEGRFDLDGEEWLVDVDGTRVVWQRGGRPHHAPPLPPAETRGRYLLSLHELLAADDSDLAGRIRIESAGGYDVPSAAASLGFGSRGRPRALIDEIRDASAALATAGERAAALARERGDLEELTWRREELRAKAARAPALDVAVRLAGHEEALARARREVEAFPGRMELLRDDDGERFRRWREDEERHRKALAGARADLDDARNRRAAEGFGDDPPSDALLGEVEGRLQKIREIDAAVSRAGERLARSRAERARADEALGTAGSLRETPVSERDGGREGEVAGGGDAAGAGEVDAGAADPDALDDPGALASLDALLRRAEALRARRAALEARLRELDAAGVGGEGEEERRGGDPDASEALDAALRALRAWLRAAAEDAGARRRRDRLVLAGAAARLALGAATVALGLLAEPRAPLVAAVGGAAAAAGALLLALRPPVPDDPRSGLEREATRHGHAPPEWSARAVEARLDELEREAVRRRRAEELASERERLSGEAADLDSEERALAGERERIAAALGLVAVPDDLSLHALGSRLLARDQAARAEATDAAELASASEALERELAEAGAALEPFGYRAHDAVALTAALADLRPRRERHRDAVRDQKDAESRSEKTEREREALAAEHAATFARLGVEGEGAEGELLGLLDGFEAYREARRELEGAARVRDTTERELRDRADGRDAAARELVEGWSERADRSALEAELEEASAAREEERSVGERIAEIERALRDARTAHHVEDALARVEAARAALAERRDEDVDAAVGDALARWLVARASDHDLPAVFHRARALFLDVTRGRYRLDLGEGDAADFRAFDHRTERGYALDELSSGTRLQLLLAVRVAFVETQEAGPKLPLLLDEVLANCDDARAGAIVDAAVALARGGRQIFYFTAQADELARWLTSLEGSDVPWVERDLRAPADEGPAFDWSPRAVAGATVPEPGGMDHTAYGRALGVPAFDLWEGHTGGLHLWYVVEDAGELHALLRLGISTWGELDAFARGAGAGAPPAVSAAHARAEGLAHLAGRLAELRRRGRGRPVDRHALVRSGAVSDTFLDRVSDLCIELGGRGSLLVEALLRGDVPRFHRAKSEELHAFFVAEGYATDEQPLDDDAIRLGLLAESHRRGLDADEAAIDALALRLARGPGDAPGEDGGP